MKQVTLYIAMSLDGYIADRNGGVDWLVGQDSAEDTGDTYSEFVKGIDTVIMGWNTYHQIVTQLSPNAWVYEDLTTYVVTHTPPPSSEKIRFTTENPAALVKRLRQEPGKGIWICGGANLVQQLISENLIDRYHMTVIPTILGSGVGLFGRAGQEIPLKLLETQSYNGMVECIYAKR